MEKRGQVTTFIIVGIVAIIAILIVFFLRNTLIETIAGSERISGYLEGQMNAINDEIKRCVNENLNKDLNILGKQGGFFNPSHYLSYYGNKISFLCMDIEDSSLCRNNGLSESVIEKQLDENLNNKLKGCINLEGFNAVSLYDYDLVYDLNSLDINSEINFDNILVNVSFPVTIKKDDFEISNNDFINIVDVPLGEFLDIVNAILSSEASIGNFNTLSYDLFSYNRYLIKKYRPLGHKLYTIQIKDSDYLFQFAVEEND